MQRSNQFDQISEIGRHEKSRRGICDIWCRDLTCDHLPKAVVQGIRQLRQIVIIILFLFKLDLRGLTHFALERQNGRVGADSTRNFP